MQQRAAAASLISPADVDTIFAGTAAIPEIGQMSFSKAELKSRGAIRDRSSGEVVDTHPSSSPKRQHTLHPFLYK